ncbi:helix-turn-helix domain-containing protein [Wohlfahrtiimonas larvae]|uniref:HTH cro/C1-type domain-containing protein n=1 Tax=Wohlfahrtiimonas larvae TaxID=1157986 RepID=A0ABP9MTW0_9GAMM|nr:helix-turn-helix transcriptional regulator [Wohlfahrtiimonas larvae]
MESIGKRLKEIRENLGMNQTVFGAIGGVGQKAQINYEKGERSPSAEYLANLSKVPTVDIQYIVTGNRSSHALSDSEQELLGALRSIDADIRAMAIAAALSVIKSGKAQESKTINQHGGQYSEGTINNVIGINNGGNKDN